MDEMVPALAVAVPVPADGNDFRSRLQILAATAGGMGRPCKELKTFPFV